MARLAPMVAAAVLFGACALEPIHPLYSPLAVAGSFGYADQRLADRVIHPDPFFRPGGFRHHHVIDRGYFGELAVRVSLTVRLTVRPSDQGFDADRTLARLRAKYPDAAGRPPPDG